MMKRQFALAFLAMTMTAAMVLPVNADRYDRQTDGHPLRIVAYVVHPLGIALEYGIMRPIHWVVSQDDLDILFGHQPKLMDDDVFFEWVHGDYTASIAEERERYLEVGIPATDLGYTDDGPEFSEAPEPMEDNWDATWGDDDQSDVGAGEWTEDAEESMDEMADDAEETLESELGMDEPATPETQPAPAAAPMPAVTRPSGYTGLSTERVSDTATTN
ncbi:MAG: hypothetical protein RLY93_19705 [Sumerlaeia bacterium]